ncbi:hypothetical protein ABID21_001863 [Pseudorhizobium tarimense]|uniref:Uncharacterized protein n=1 Tax=Pseudorhizobium tarimense TaxID=1079109 RepID=A0ABV2H5G2_9HYPH|nr:hypothetical protein [Pseudorhizobium tarimense]MCJ8518961.1 hypothetical protein [Pseudorhizobium tarimense]
MPEVINIRSKMYRRRMTDPVSAPGSKRLAGLPVDYPVNTLFLIRLVWFLRHNSKGKPVRAILSIELTGYWKPLIRKCWCANVSGIARLTRIPGAGRLQLGAVKEWVL